MASLLSPGITVTEKNFGYSVGALPSSNTFGVLRAEKGEAFTVVLTSSEAELVSNFGRPTNNNFLDWFNINNFYDYASSMYVSRPIDALKTTKNVGLVLSGGDDSDPLTVNEGISQANLYNQTTAEGTLSSLVTDTQTKLLAVGTEESTDWAWTSLGQVGVDDYALSAKGLTGADSAILVVNSIDTLGIGGSDPNWTVELLNDAALQGWGITTGTLNFTDGVAFVVGETVTGTSSGATATVVSIDTNLLVVSSVANGGTASQVFGDGTTEAITGSASGTGSACGPLELASFTATDVTGTVTVAGTVASSKLTFYNRYVAPTQDIAIGVCSALASWTGQVATSGDTNTFSSYFEYAPDFSNDEFALLVYEQETDSTWTQVESYTVSAVSTGKDVYGRSNFVDDILLAADSRIFCKVGANGVMPNTESSPLPVLRHTWYDTIYPRTYDTWPAAEYDATAYTSGDIQECYDLIDDPDTTDIGLIMNHFLDQEYASTVAALRKDAFAIVSPYSSSDLVGKSSDDAVTYLTTAMGTVNYSTGEVDDFNNHNTYTGMFGNMKYMFDRYNDMNRWVPIHGDMAGIMAETDRLFFPWYAPAGLNRGKIRNAIKLAFNPNQAGRDSLYVNGINIVYAIAGEGQGVVWGQKTATSVASIFSRINIRRLMITLEKEISKSMRPFVMEFADETTWNQILGVINPYLGNVQANRGLEDFLVVCDSSNNTAEVINQNKIVVDIFVKPQQVAEFIQLNFNVTKSGVSFEELI